MQGRSSGGTAARESMAGGERSGMGRTRMRVNGAAATPGDFPTVAPPVDGPTVVAREDCRRVAAVSGKLTRALV